jgi:hypothetical protein
VSTLTRPIRPLTDPARLLQSRVAELSWARRRSDAARLAVCGIAIGGGAAALIGSLAQLVDSELGPIAAGTAFIAIVAGLALGGWLRQPPLARVTLELDRLLALDERVTTALELAERQRAGEKSSTPRPRAMSRSQPPRSTAEMSSLAQQQIADAVESLSWAATRSPYPLRVSRRVQALAAIGLILAALPWLVPLPVLLQSYLPPSPVALATQAEAGRLETVVRRLQSDPAPADRATRDAVAAQLQRAAAALRQSGGNASSATKALQSAEQAVLATSPQSSQDASQTLARIADALNSDPLTQPATQALDARDVAKAAAAMSQLAANLGGMSAQQRGDLANALQSASNAARSGDSAAADQLQQAANAARDGNANGMQQAAQALQRLGATSSAQSDIAQGRSELQASRDALTSASQSGQSGASGSPGTNQNSPSQASNGAPHGGTGDSASQANSASGTSDQTGASGNGAQPGSAAAGEPGGGAGKGSADHLGTPNDLQGLAQRQVMVPSNGPPDSGSISLSNQTEVGSAGSAQVDYANVLPQYRSQALQNISGNEVPSGLKQVVKGYFDSLAPK